MKTSSRIAITAAASLVLGSMVLTPVKAADLGGNCCADLEERVAELEATTVRKGNRKVSLQLSGQVNRSLLWWNDGDESNVYVVDNSNSSSRFRMKGKARIHPGLSAGFLIEIQVQNAAGGSVNQNDDNGGVNGDAQLSGRKIAWWIKSDHLGTITVGRYSPATDDLILIDLGGTGQVAPNAVFVGNGFFTRDSTVAGRTGQNSETWGEFYAGLDTSRRDGIRYDTPTLMGFTVSAFWGEDDYWDVALKYANEWNGLRVAFGVGYNQDLDEGTAAMAAVQEAGNRDQTEIKGSASVWHVPTGIFVTAAFVHREYNGTNPSDTTVGVYTAPRTSRSDDDFWYAKGGWRGRLNSLGQTTVYGEYAEADGFVDGTNYVCRSCALEGKDVAGDIDEVTDSSSSFWGVGIVQRIDAAAMELYLGYRHFEANVKGWDTGAGAIVNAPLEDLEQVNAGGRIRF